MFLFKFSVPVFVVFCGLILGKALDVINLWLGAM